MMKMRIAILFIFLLNFELHAQSLDWAVPIGGTGTDQGFSLIADDSFYVYAVGYFQDSISVGTNQLFPSQGSNNMYIACFDQQGNVIWAKQSVSSSYVYGLSISLDHTGAIFITGYFGGTIHFGNISLSSAGYHDMFLLKLDRSGNFLWGRSGGGIGSTSGDVGRDLAVDGDGNVYVIGEFEGQADFGDIQINSVGMADVYLAKYNTDGREEWVVRGGGSFAERATAITINETNEIYIGGSFKGNASFAQDTLRALGFEEAFFAKYNSDGNLIWVNKLGSDGEVVIRSMDMQDSQNLLCAGSFSSNIKVDNLQLNSNGAEDFFFAKIDSIGNLRWINTGGGLFTDRIYSISSNMDEEIFIGGVFQFNLHLRNDTLASSGLGDAFIGQYAATGEFKWARKLGGSSDDVTWDLSATQNSVIVTGSFFKDAAFGRNNNIVLHAFSENKADAFLAKIESDTLLPPLSSYPFEVGSEINVYPNPSTGYINIEFEEAFDKVESIKLMDARGKLIKHIDKPNLSRHFKMYLGNGNLSENSCLFLVFSFANHVFSRKIIIKSG